MTNYKTPLILHFIVAALLIAIITMMMLSIFPTLRSEVAAAWVQGFGALAGMALAIFLMYMQGARSDHSEALKIGRGLDAIEALIERGYWVSEVMEKHTSEVGISDWDDYFFAVIDVDAMQTITQALKAIPLHEMLSYDIVVGINEMTVGLERLRPLAESHRDGSDVHANFVGDECLAVQYHCRKIREAKDKVIDSIRNLGHKPSTPRSPVIR